MKKEINSKSRRKWIMGGLAAFASVALLTTGFAVWVVGTSKTGDDKDVTVKVDTAKNNSISFNLDLGTNPTIKLEESTTTAAANASGKPLVNVSANEGEGAAFVESPMTLSASYTIKYGAGYKFNFTKIHFSIATEANEGETDFDKNYVTNKVKADNVKMGTTKNSEDAVAITKDFARDASTTDYTYFEAPADCTIAGTTTGGKGENKTITGTISLKFTWGTLFGKEASPATYYNNWATSKNINGVTDTNITDALTEEVTQEMNAMHSQLDGKKIRLKAELAE